MRLKDRVAILTGGAGGIGREACELFTAEGAKLMIADVDFDGATKLSEELNARGHGTKAMNIDDRIQKRLAKFPEDVKWEEMVSSGS